MPDRSNEFERKENIQESLCVRTRATEKIELASNQMQEVANGSLCFVLCCVVLIVEIRVRFLDMSSLRYQLHIESEAVEEGIRYVAPEFRREV